MQTRRTIAILAATLALPAAAAAGMARSFLVPSYVPCPGPATCAPERQSSFTFESALMKSSQRRYLVPGKVVLVIELKGVRDAGGQLVTTNPKDPSDDFLLIVPATQVTLAGVGTLPPGLSPETRLRIDLVNGNGSQRLTTPEETPEHGLVANSAGLPEVFDNQGKRLAVTGSQTAP